MSKKKSPKRKLKFHFTPIHDRYTGQDLPIHTFHGKEVVAPVDLPSKVTVLGTVYDVRYHTYIYSAPHKTAGLHGMVIYNYNTIFINPLQSIQDMQKTLLHEIYHIHLHQWQKAKDSLSQLTGAQVEDACDLFADAFHDIAKANPKILG